MAAFALALGFSLPLAGSSALAKGKRVTTLAEVAGGTGGVVVDARGVVYSADFGERLGPGGKAGTRLFRITPDGETGVFADGLRQKDDPDAATTLTPSQGIHLVLDRSFHPGESALMVPKTDDDRVLFMIPWHDKVLVGTLCTQGHPDR